MPALSPSSASSSPSRCIGSSMPIAVLSNGRSNADMKNTITSVPMPMYSIMLEPGRWFNLNNAPKMTSEAPQL